MLPTTLVLHATRNTGTRHDAIGAFIPEAQAFARTRVSTVVGIDNSVPQLKRARAYVEALEAQSTAASPVSALVQLSHGYVHGTQLSPRAPGHPAFRFGGNAELWGRMVAALARVKDPLVILYACSTGDDPDDDPDSAPGAGDGSFADQLRDALCQAGAVDCRIVAHTTAGHCTRNPHVKIFEGRGSVLGGVGASPLVPPSMIPTFARMLNAPGDFRFRFPFMPIADVHAAVAEADRAFHGGPRALA